MVDVLLLTPREVPTGLTGLHNEQVVVTDAEYALLEPALRQFYEKVRENLGIACLAGQLRSVGRTVRVVNLHGHQPSDGQVEELVRRERPLVVGISLMYDLHLIDAVALVGAARRARPDAFIVLGGAFCTYNAPLLAGSLPEVDCVAYGEAEETFTALVEHVGRGGSTWQAVPGIAYADSSGVVDTGPPSLPNLNVVPWAARDTLEQHRAAGLSTPVASSYTSRGCHAKCTFCYAPSQPGAPTNPWRFREPGSVVDEIEYLKRDFGTRFIWFNDDNFGGAFAAGHEHAVALAEELVRRDLGVAFHCEFRVDSGLIDRDVLDLLRRAGMASALLGIESGSPGMLRRFKKGVTLPYNLGAARMFKDVGLGLDPGWIMIEPGTTFDELWENAAFMAATGIHETNNPFFLVNRAVALRGTELFASIAEPGADPELDGVAEPAASVLAAARRTYVVADPRVEALWAAWSEIGGELSARNENDLPFLAQRIADASRAARGTDRPNPRPMLGRIRTWRRGLPALFLTLVTVGLSLADEDPEDLPQALADHLGSLVLAYDEQCFDGPYEHFAATVEALAQDRRAVSSGGAA